MLAACVAPCGPIKIPGPLHHVSDDRSGCFAAGVVLTSFFPRVKCWWWRAEIKAPPRRSVTARARLSSFFSSWIGLDSQASETDDTSQLLRIGPVPGDIAEVEAYCRIFRAAEQLCAVIVDTLCNPETGECAVNYDIPPEDMPLLEDKVIALLDCMLALVNMGRKEVPYGRFSVMGSFLITDVNVIEGKLPPLALFRDEMKKCCESLQVALTNYLINFDDSRAEILRRMQRLKNACYDAGFFRGDECPCPTILANWRPVYFSTLKEDKVTENSEAAFWVGGQVTVEGLSWLLEKGFKTIVDMREEAMVDEYYNAVLDEAICHGKIEVIRFPVETGTAPTMKQVEKFASWISDPAKRPIYLHSKEGVGRTSAMVSLWRQHVTQSIVQSASGYSHNQNGRSARNAMDEKSQEAPELTLTKNGTANFSTGHIKLDSRSDDELASDSNVTSFKDGMILGTGNPESFDANMSDYSGNQKCNDSMAKNGIEQVLSTSVEDKQKKDKGSTVADNDSMSCFEENMCASTTGVVRVQSRKKAEMFLVHTDGFSCTKEKVTETSLAFTHPSTQQQMLMWQSPPKTVLLLKKLGQELMEEMKEVASFLYHQEKMNVLVEPDVHDILARIPDFGFVQTYSQNTSDLHEMVDFVACLGGDGLILHASNLFRGAVPPVVSFNLGSLGFLTSHTFEEYKEDLKAVIHGSNSRGVYITVRMRLRCEIFRNEKPVPGKVFDVLNEVVVDRGSNPYLSKIECYEHDRLITKVQGDGVIVATPTGSTAYSTAAGGSMVHPNVPCILFTPICPHSLSFLPVVLPDSAKLILKIPEDSRSNARVSFDGKRRQQLSRGDSVHIFMSKYPLPTVNKYDQTGDWFHSLVRCLNWNERLDQKAL